MYVPLWTCLRAPFLHFAWTSFTVLGSSYGCKTCTFLLLFLTCAFKGEDFFLKFWYVVFLESFSSNYFVTEIVVHFGGYLWVYFISTKQQNFPVAHFQWIPAEVLWEQSTLYVISVLRCRGRLLYTRLAEKWVWPPRPRLHPPSPHPVTWLWFTYLSLTSFETILLYCIMTNAISVWVKKNSSKLWSVCVTIFIFKVDEHK